VRISVNECQRSVGNSTFISNPTCSPETSVYAVKTTRYYNAEHYSMNNQSSENLTTCAHDILVCSHSANSRCVGRHFCARWRCTIREQTLVSGFQPAQHHSMLAIGSTLTNLIMPTEARGENPMYNGNRGTLRFFLIAYYSIPLQLPRSSVY
jgi:hypothetical protein